MAMGTCTARNQQGHGQTVLWSHPNHGDPAKNQRTARQFGKVPDGTKLFIEAVDNDFYQVRPLFNGFENPYVEKEAADCGWVKEWHLTDVQWNHPQGAPGSSTDEPPQGAPEGVWGGVWAVKHEPSEMAEPNAVQRKKQRREPLEDERPVKARKEEDKKGDK
jgi:hypothetical protein